HHLDETDHSARDRMDSLIEQMRQTALEDIDRVESNGEVMLTNKLETLVRDMEAFQGKLKETSNNQSTDSLEAEMQSLAQKVDNELGMIHRIEKINQLKRKAKQLEVDIHLALQLDYIKKDKSDFVWLTKMKNSTLLI